MPDLETKRVLVVDDDDSIRTMVERVLKREKYQVECARDGAEAIEKLKANEYEAVLLDLMMPKVDGLGVIQFLEDHRPQSTRSVIVMSADFVGAMEAATRRGLAVIPKPFDIAQLVGRVRENLAEV